MKEQLEKLRNAKFLGVTELANVAAQVLARGRAQQERGSVTEFPDERTVRYYQSEGLISPPTERQGNASVFTYRHLVELLAIKRLQAESLPIKKIREVITGKSEKELEKLLGVNGLKGKNEAQKYLETLLLRRGPETGEFDEPLFSRPPASFQAPDDSKKIQTWQRFEISPGLELHVEKKFNLPASSRERRILIETIKQIIESAAAEIKIRKKER